MTPVSIQQMHHGAYKYYKHLFVSDCPEPLTNMTCEKFADFIGQKMADYSETLRSQISHVINEENISSTCFADLSNDVLQQVFECYGVKYTLGVRACCQKVQDMIRKHQENPDRGFKSVLRKFGTHFANRKYTVCTVQSAHDDSLLDPVHCFSYPKMRKEVCLCHFVKEVVRFTAGCINTMQNGTLHFGILPKENGLGQILGVDISKCLNANEVDLAVQTAIEISFSKRNRCQVMRCIGPVQIIPVEEGGSVLELDVHPCSMYLSGDILITMYPPKGNQEEIVFCYVRSSKAVEKIGKSRLEEMSDLLSQAVCERMRLEEWSGNKNYETKYHFAKLRECLTAGNEYVTDQLYPLFVISSYTTTADTECVEQILASMKTAFLSSPLIFDFEKSTYLIKIIEGNDNFFHVHLAENVHDSTSGSRLLTENIWLYCNGNDEHSAQRMRLQDYTDHRDEGVRSLLKESFDLFGKRNLIVFLVFEKLSKSDPLFHLAEDVRRIYKGTPVIISDQDKNVEDLRNEYGRFVTESELNLLFHTSLSWGDTVEIISSVFRPDPDTVCKFPTAFGSSVFMSKKEKKELKVDDIELISEDLCTQFETMDDRQRWEKEKTDKENFYRGNEASWYNFFTRTNVCKREVFQTHVAAIEKKIRKGDERFEIVEILHQPGAGGTTLGKHLIWHFSQFVKSTHERYRCCLVKTVNVEETARQITRFRNFKEKRPEKAGPVIVLVDNKSDEVKKQFKDDIDKEAYRHGSQGKLFCLLIFVSRVSAEESDPKKVVLRHTLSTAEATWFEDRFQKEMRSFGEKYVKSLIAFNVMKENFSETYIKNTTMELMKELNKQESTMLQHLAIVNYYDLLERPIPTSVFDNVMGFFRSSGKQYAIQELISSRRSVGLVANMKRNTKITKTWNACVSEPCSLLLKCKSVEYKKANLCKFKSADGNEALSKNFQALSYQQGYLIVSPLVALAVIKTTQQTRKKSLSDLVKELLEFAKQQQKTVGDIASDSFADIVCSLFKLRETYKVKGGKETKAKFSKLVLSFTDPGHGDSLNKENEKTVLNLMESCFRDFNDPYVGQQLARYYIRLEKLDEAEKEIKTAIDKMPSNPFLHSTLGYIHKRKMEKIFDKADKQNSENAVQMILTGLEAINVFVKAQDLAKTGPALELERDDGLNSFLQNEVSAALLVLEKCCDFDCCSDNSKFSEFINGQQSNAFDCLQPSIDGFRKGQAIQCHFHNSLRHLEYARGMVKRNFSEIRSNEDDRIAIELRKKFNSLYNGRNNKFPGETFQSLRDRVASGDYRYLKYLSQEVYRSLKISEEQEKDLLMYIGSELILLSNKKSKISDDRYRELLRYTKDLADMQLHSHGMPYIEAFLYLVLFHWPLPERIKKHSTAICSFNTLQRAIDKWKAEYSKLFKKMPTMYFALWKGIPGEDIIDQDHVRSEWHRYENPDPSFRHEVKSVDIWNNDYFRTKYVSLKGIVDDSGKYIRHEVNR